MNIIIGVLVKFNCSDIIVGGNDDTDHVEDLCEGDPHLDDHGLGGIVHGPHLPVIVLHQVSQQSRLLLLVTRLLLHVGIVSSI